MHSATGAEESTDKNRFQLTMPKLRSTCPRASRTVSAPYPHRIRTGDNIWTAQSIAGRYTMACV
jgi:hypothetical protein